MRKCAESEFAWIRGGVDELVPAESPNWKGNVVTHLMPAKFEAYAKILHRITAKYENIDNPLIDREIALLKIPSCSELRRFVETLREKGEGPKIRWRQLAELLGVPFGAEICHEWFRQSLAGPTCWSRFLFGPDEGNLDSEELDEVIRFFSPLQAGKNRFFALRQSRSLVRRGPFFSPGNCTRFRDF